MMAPASRIRSRPIFQFHSVREPTASDATCTREPSRKAPRAVCITQMWLSIPQSRTVLRLPGSRFSMEQKTSLPKQENTCLSTACTSGSREAISDTVSPNPFAYCVLISTGIFKIPAKRISSREFLSNCSLCNIGGRSFSWISTTMSAHWLASRARRATSLYSLVIGLTLPRTVAMRDFPNNDSTPPKSTNQSELRWPFVLTAVNAAHKIKAAERFRSIKIAPSFNGRTADSGSAYRGSNPWGAANHLALIPFKTAVLLDLSRIAEDTGVSQEDTKW